MKYRHVRESPLHFNMMLTLKNISILAVALIALSLAEVSAQPCFLCGSADDQYENPSEIVPLPDDLASMLPPGFTQITCGQIEQAALAGLLDAELCAMAVEDPELAAL